MFLIIAQVILTIADVKTRLSCARANSIPKQKLYILNSNSVHVADKPILQYLSTRH